MNKDEILKKSREQKEDEGVIHTENKCRVFGFMGLSIMMAILAIIFVFIGGANMNVPFSMWCAYLGAEGFGKYSTSKNKSQLIVGIITSLAAALFLGAYLFIDVLGVIVY